VTQAVLTRIPVRPRRAVSRAVESWLDGSSAGGHEHGRRRERPPEADLEMSLLQTGAYRFPIDKARRLLGYDPPVPFDEACRRTLGWLRFAGYPVRDAT
jgi:nucleoside-diphosphate-sugar epimerase